MFATGQALRPAQASRDMAMTAEPSYSIELLRDDDAIANAIEASAGAVLTAFQDPRWELLSESATAAWR
jgi:hypothetical protein